MCWPGTRSLCCVLEQDTLLSQYLSPHRSKWVPANCQGNLTEMLRRGRRRPYVNKVKNKDNISKISNKIFIIKRHLKRFSPVLAPLCHATLRSRERSVAWQRGARTGLEKIMIHPRGGYSGILVTGRCEWLEAKFVDCPKKSNTPESVQTTCISLFLCRNCSAPVPEFLK